MAMVPERKKGLSGLMGVAKKQRGRLLGSIGLAVAGQSAGLVPYFMISCIITQVAAAPMDQIPPGDLYWPLVYGAVGLLLRQIFTAAS